MRRATLVVTVLTCISLAASAQQIIPILSGGNVLMLLQNPDVQKDLKLSADQKAKITELRDKYRESVKGSDIRKAQELIKSTTEEAGKVIYAGQAKRLEEIKFQQMGSRAFFDAKIAADLRLADDQKAKIRDIVKSARSKKVELYNDKTMAGKDRQAKLADLEKAEIADCVQALNEKQQAHWRGLAGKSFQGNLPTSAGAGNFFPLPGGSAPKGFSLLDFTDGSMGMISAIAKVDVEKNTITLKTPGDIDMKHGNFKFTIGKAATKDFVIPKEAKILDDKGQELKDGLKAAFFEKPGGVVTIRFIRKDAKDIVTQVRIGGEPSAKKLEKKLDKK